MNETNDVECIHGVLQEASRIAADNSEDSSLSSALQRRLSREELALRHLMGFISTHPEATDHLRPAIEEYMRRVEGLSSTTLEDEEAQASQQRNSQQELEAIMDDPDLPWNAQGKRMAAGDAEGVMARDDSEVVDIMAGDDAAEDDMLVSAANVLGKGVRWSAPKLQTAAVVAADAAAWTGRHTIVPAVKMISRPAHERYDGSEAKVSSGTSMALGGARMIGKGALWASSKLAEGLSSAATGAGAVLARDTHFGLQMDDLNARRVKAGKELARDMFQGASEVMDGVEEGGRIVVKASADSTVEVVDYCHGKEAAGAAAQVGAFVMDAYKTQQHVSSIKSAPVKVAGDAAKHAAKVASTDPTQVEYDEIEEALASDEASSIVASVGTKVGEIAAIPVAWMLNKAGETLQAPLPGAAKKAQRRKELLKRGIRGAPQMEDSSEWACHSCTFINSPERIQCELCASTRARR